MPYIESMIVVRLIGRLGNQLFQYAVGRALSLRLGVDLALDARGYPGKRGWHCGLDAFAVKTVPVDHRHLPATGRGLARLLRPLRKTPFTIFRERQFAFDAGVLALSDWTYLQGYFQSEKYFRDHVATIRNDLAIQQPPDADNSRLAEQMANCCAVSLHVRRGDYVTDPKVSAGLGCLDLDYHVRASELVAARAGADPTFFVFSDDPDWVEGNLRLRFPLVVVRQDAPAHEDLRLMAACRHHIVANSSFSWWGAWLNPSPDKIVVAPKTWFRDPAIDTGTLVPEGWLRT